MGKKTKEKTKLLTRQGIVNIRPKSVGYITHLIPKKEKNKFDFVIEISFKNIDLSEKALQKLLKIY